MVYTGEDTCGPHARVHKEEMQRSATNIYLFFIVEYINIYIL